MKKPAKKSVKPTASLTLSEWLEREGMLPSHFAIAVGVSAATISRIVAQGKTPSLRVALKIEAATNGDIPVTAWI